MSYGLRPQHYGRETIGRKHRSPDHGRETVGRKPRSPDQKAYMEFFMI